MAIVIRALQWSGNPYGNGYGVEMDGNGAQFVKILMIGLDLGQTLNDMIDIEPSENMIKVTQKQG